MARQFEKPRSHATEKISLHHAEKLRDLTQIAVGIHSALLTSTNDILEKVQEVKQSVDERKTVSISFSPEDLPSFIPGSETLSPSPISSLPDAEARMNEPEEYSEDFARVVLTDLIHSRATDSDIADFILKYTSVTGLFRKNLLVSFLKRLKENKDEDLLKQYTKIEASHAESFCSGTARVLETLEFIDDPGNDAQKNFIKFCPSLSNGLLHAIAPHLLKGMDKHQKLPFCKDLLLKRLISWGNQRMNDVTTEEGMKQLQNDIGKQQIQHAEYRFSLKNQWTLLKWVIFESKSNNASQFYSITQLTAFINHLYRLFSLAQEWNFPHQEEQIRTLIVVVKKKISANQEFFAHFKKLFSHEADFIGEIATAEEVAEYSNNFDAAVDTLESMVQISRLQTPEYSVLKEHFHSKLNDAKTTHQQESVDKLLNWRGLTNAQNLSQEKLTEFGEQLDDELSGVIASAYSDDCQISDAQLKALENMLDVVEIATSMVKDKDDED